MPTNPPVNLDLTASTSATEVPLTKIRLMVVDDHPVVRLGLNALLSTQEDFIVVGLAEHGEAALEVLRRQAIDVILLDLRMPGLSGNETLRRINEEATGAKTIVVSSFEYDEEIYASVRAGARGFVHKEASSEEILAAIRTIARGGRAFPKRIADRLADDQMTAGVSPREIEILQLVSKGLTNKEIGKVLNLSQFTVRNHLNHITQKLEASDRTEAIFIALQSGLISPP
jgi:DNA-binding NarL/FixJ family response regulator